MSYEKRESIYLDHHATTPVDERVLAKMMPYFVERFGNPSSKSHHYGWHAQEAINEARILFGKAIGAHPTEIIFTSGATEATNMALKGLFSHGSQKRHMVTSSIEHSATVETAQALMRDGVTATFIRPTRDGLIDLSAIKAAVRDDTAVISLFFVQNEVGTINDIAAIARFARHAGIYLHVDAAQALGRVPIDCQSLGVDLMSFSGHKIYGPKGIGALFLRREIMPEVVPLIHGGGQEWHKRSGTPNVPGIVGLGEAAHLAAAEMVEECQKINGLRDRLLSKLQVLDGVHINGTLEHRVACNLSVSFAGIDGEELLLAICPDVAVSSGSACAGLKKSRVLAELGVSAELAQATVRFGIGRNNTAFEIDRASELVVAHVKALRANRRKIVKIGSTDGLTKNQKKRGKDPTGLR